MGRKRICFLGYNVDAREVHQRYLGFVQAMEDAGLEIDPALVLPVHFEIESAEAAVRGLLSKGVGFDGIVAASDLIAQGAIRALISAGQRVPQDVSVVGYDDIQLARYSRPSITTISQDMARAGRIIVSKILNTPPGQPLLSERLATDLIVRESCGG